MAEQGAAVMQLQVPATIMYATGKEGCGLCASPRPACGTSLWITSTMACSQVSPFLSCFCYPLLQSLTSGV